MQYLTGITNNPTQSFVIAIGDGTNANISLYYSNNQQGWFMDLSWTGTTPNFQVNGNRVTVFPNLLRQYKYVLPFGLGCVTSDGYEPMNLDDFSSGYARLIILTQAQVQAIENTVFVGN
jgi:hypothetical protein